MMDESLLGRAVQHHGPDFLRQLQLEQEQIPPNIFLHLQKHRPQIPEINDPQFILNVRRFVAKKADVLFRPIDKMDGQPLDQPVDEDSYAKMPPLETFMGVDPHSARKHLFLSLREKDIMIGVVTSIVDTGLVLQLLCPDEGKCRDIDDLRINAFVRSTDIPKMFPTQNPVEGYQVKDYIRGVIVSVNPDSETILLSLMDAALGEMPAPKPRLGLIHEEDFPVQYRRKLHVRGLTFDELVNSILGFTNPGNVPFLLKMFHQKEDVSMMRGLYRLKLSEKDYADNLRKQQSQKWAYQCVAQGIHDFKAGRQTEAMQSFNKALQIDSSNVEALVARGALYANNESYTRALIDFEEAIAVNPKHPNAIKYMHETLLAKGKCHEDDRQYDDAKQCYQRAVDIMPDSAEAKEYLRYIEYKMERDGGKSRVKKERSPSPVSHADPSAVPYKETTDTLKKLIQEEKKSKSKKSIERDYSEVKLKRARSPSPRRRHRRSSSSLSSSSSSSSSSRSRSRSKRSSQKEKSKDQRSPGYLSRLKVKRSPEHGPKDSKNYTDHSQPAGGKPKDIYDERRQLDKKQNEARYPDSGKPEMQSGFFSFSRTTDKIPGLGDSPQHLEEASPQKSSNSRPVPAQDSPGRQPKSEASKYPDDDRGDDRVYERRPPPVPRKHQEERLPSIGKEVTSSFEGLDRSREEKRPGKGDRYVRAKDEDFELYGHSLDVKDEYKRRDSYGTDRNRSRPRSTDASVKIEVKAPSHDRLPEREVKVQGKDYLGVTSSRHTSVTPTKDEVSDRLGLEDISSPEDHPGEDYRLRAYGKDDDRYRKYERPRGDYRSRDFSLERDGGHRDYGRYSPERRKYSPDRRSPERRKYSPEKRMYSPDRRSSERRASSRDVRGSSRDRRDISGHQDRKYREEYDEKRYKKEQSPEEVQERRIISVSKKEKKTSVKSYELDRGDFKRESQSREDRRSTDTFALQESLEKRSIVIGKKETKSMRSVTPQQDRYPERKEREMYEGHRSRSRSPGYRRSRDDRYSDKVRDDVYKIREIEDKRQISIQRKHSDSRSRSRTPQSLKRDDNRKTSRDGGEESYQRTIAVKPRQLDNKQGQDVRGLSREPHPGQRSAGDQAVLQTDIFADLPPPKEEKPSQLFATYVPRAVKLKQQHPVGLNPESGPPPVQQTAAHKDDWKVYVKTAGDIKEERSKPQIDKEDPRFKFRPKTPPSKIKSSRHKSRSRSRSYDDRSKRRRHSSSSSRGSRSRSRERHRSRSRDKHRSKSRERYRSRSRDKHRSKSRERYRSRSRDKYGSRKDFKHRKRSSSSSRSRSRSYERSSRSRKINNDLPVKKVQQIGNKIDADLPKVSSRWDSPEDKKSRWENPVYVPKVVPVASVSQAQLSVANMMAANLISKSPPPHRRMKPEEKEALLKKWKELSVSPPAQEEEEKPLTDKKLKEIVKKRAAAVEKNLFPIKDENSKPADDKIQEKYSASENTNSTKAKQKKFKLKGLRSKWDSESESDRSRSRSKSRSLERKSKSDIKRKSEQRDKSRERSKSRSIKKQKYKSRSRSHSKDRKTSSSRRSKSRSNERSSRDYRDRSRSKEKSGKDGGKSLPDVVTSAKKDSGESKLKKDTSKREYLGRNVFPTAGKSRKSRSPDSKRSRSKSPRSRKLSARKSRSRSPVSKKTPGMAKGKPVKPNVKSKWSSGSDSDSDVQKTNGKGAGKGAGKGVDIPKDSLTELVEFYNKLKEQDKLRRKSGDTK